MKHYFDDLIEKPVFISARASQFFSIRKQKSKLMNKLVKTLFSFFLINLTLFVLGVGWWGAGEGAKKAPSPDGVRTTTCEKL